MASSWLSSFRDIGWDKVVGANASVVDGARGLWQRLRGAAAEETAPPHPRNALNPEVMAAIDLRVQPLAKRVAALDQEVRSSFEVVNSMAQQHTQLVQAVDLLLARTRLLLLLCGLLGAASLVLLLLLLLRW